MLSCVLPAIAKIVPLSYAANFMEIYRRKDELSSPGIAANRRLLVEQFNSIVGLPGPQEIAVQEEFIAEKMTEGRALSYIKFLQHMIASTNSRDSGTT